MKSPYLEPPITQKEEKRREEKRREEKRSAKKNSINPYDYFSIINQAIKTPTIDLIK